MAHHDDAQSAQDDEYAAAVELWHALGAEGQRAVLRAVLRIHQAWPAPTVPPAEAGHAAAP